MKAPYILIVDDDADVRQLLRPFLPVGAGHMHVTEGDRRPCPLESLNANRRR
jgi:CheY-like chemotaxis protein